MRKLISILLILALGIGVTIYLFGCKENVEPIEYDVQVNLEQIVKPTNLPDYSLSIEWFDQFGQTTSFVKNKPVMILFNGFSEYNREESLTLPEDIYGASNTQVISASIAPTFNRNLSFYWNKLVLQYNVGVFHYEHFADDTDFNINSKIYDESKCTYKIGEEDIQQADFNLTEAFISAWKTIIDDESLTGSDGNSILEVRFIGNSVGANLALSCADYLYAAFEQNLIPSTYVPNRITMTNPWLSNDEDLSTKVSFRKEKELNSAISYNEKRITELAVKGVVFELIEGDPTFYNSYENIYDGCLAEIIVDNESTPIWESGIDTDLYESIKSNVAYLTFAETYSLQYTDSYKKYDRAVLDWYLYTAGGSDSSSITTLRAGFKPIYDSWGHPSVTHNSYTESTTNGYSMKYGISAWTPTIYLRAVRGVEYSMKVYNSSGSTNHVLVKYQAEARQMSNLDMENGFFVCGYIYESMDMTSFVNLLPGAGFPNYTFSIVATPEQEYSSIEQVFLVTTEEDGFYKCVLNEELYACTIKINLVSPSPDYSFFPSTDVVTGNIWTLCDVNSIGREGITANMFGTENSNFFILIRNCGFLKNN